MLCPQCSQPISVDDVNVQAGAALCRGCGKLTRLRELALATEVDDAGESEPPRGCRVVDDGFETRVIVSTRSWTGAGVLLVVVVLWNAVVLSAVAVTLASTVYSVTGSVPAWFPAWARNYARNGGFASGWWLVPVWIFLTPFVVIGIGLVVAWLQAVVGRFELRLRGPEASVFTGVGPIGWRRRFDPGSVTSVKIERVSWKSSGVFRAGHEHRDDPVPTQIRIDADRTITFAAGLEEDRQAWLVAACRRLLMPAGRGGRGRDARALV